MNYSVGSRPIAPYPLQSSSGDGSQIWRPLYPSRGSSSDIAPKSGNSLIVSPTSSEATASYGPAQVIIDRAEARRRQTRLKKSAVRFAFSEKVEELRELLDDVVYVRHKACTASLLECARECIEALGERRQTILEYGVSALRHVHVITTADGIVLEATGAALSQFLQYDPEDLIGRNIYDFCHSDDWPVLMRTLNKGGTGHVLVLDKRRQYVLMQVSVRKYVPSADGDYVCVVLLRKSSGEADLPPTLGPPGAISTRTAYTGLYTFPDSQAAVVTCLHSVSGIDEVHGIPVSAASGLSMRLVFHPEDMSVAVQSFEFLRRIGSPTRITARVLNRRQGTWEFIRIYNEVCYDRRRRMVGLYAFTEEISEEEFNRSHRVEFLHGTGPHVISRVEDMLPYVEDQTERHRREFVEKDREDAAGVEAEDKRLMRELEMYFRGIGPANNAGLRSIEF